MGKRFTSTGPLDIGPFQPINKDGKIVDGTVQVTCSLIADGEKYPSSRCACNQSVLPYLGGKLPGEMTGDDLQAAIIKGVYADYATKAEYDAIETARAVGARIP